MNKRIIEAIKKALVLAQRNGFMAQLHLQSIKTADELGNITSREFCEELGLKPIFGTEFNKMRNLTTRLKAADLVTEKI